MKTDPSLTSAACGALAQSQALQQHIARAIAAAGGWIGFDAFMDMALYTPGLGYYAGEAPKFGQLPQGAPGAAQAGSDFVTAPELTPLFGYALARQLAQALDATASRAIWEFGAGSGVLALQLLRALDAMGQTLECYTIVEVSASLRARQRATLAEYGARVQWADTLPQSLHAVVLGNELLDAMPVQLLQRTQGVWHERGVECRGGALVWSDRPTHLRPPLDVAGAHDYLTEVHPQAEAFVRTLGQCLAHGAVFLLDYGFPEAEYYHAQRHMGTLMCHRAHRADAAALDDVGLKDITAHVNFTGVAVAAQEAGLEVLGYTSQAHFLINCGLVEWMQNAPLAQRAAAQKLILEHEMGELFKVLALGRPPFTPLGFVRGDRTHRL